MSEAIWSLDPDVPIEDVGSLEGIVSRSIGQPRLILALLAAFAGLGLILGMVGVYGIVAYNVNARTREIGIRVALGAGPSRIVRTALVEGVRLAVLGVAIGALGALALSRVLRGFVFEVSTTDPATIGGVALLLVSVTALASYVPARRAAWVDPVAALQ